LCSILKTNLSLGSYTLDARSCDDFNVRSEAPIPLGYRFYDDKPYDDLKEVSHP